MSQSDRSDSSDVYALATLTATVFSPNLFFFSTATDSTKGIDGPDSYTPINSIFLDLKVKVGTGPGLASARVPLGLYSWEEQGMTSVRMAKLMFLPNLGKLHLTTWPLVQISICSCRDLTEPQEPSLTPTDSAASWNPSII